MEIRHPATYLVGTLTPCHALQFKDGQVLNALVKDVTQGEVILLIQGTRVKARADVSLVTGQLLPVQVERSEIDGRFLLKIIPSVQSGGAARAGGVISQLLTDFGLGNGPNELLLVEKMIELGVPVTAQGVKFLSKVAGAAPLSPWEAMAMVRLWSRGLPVTGDSVRLLASLLGQAKENCLSQLLAGLETLIGRSPGKAELNSQVQMVNRLFQQTVFLVQDSQNQTAAKLNMLRQVLGFDYESLLAKEVMGEGASGQDRPSLAEESNKLLFLSRLKPALLALTEELDQAGHYAVAEKARALADMVTGVQLLNAGQHQFNHVAVHLLGWLLFSEGDSPFFLTVEQFSGRQSVSREENGIKVFLYTETPRLNQVLAELHLCGQWLTCGLTVQLPEVRDLMDDHKDELLAALQVLPWHVQVLPCRLAVKQPVREMWLRQLIRSGGTGIPQLDVRV